MLADQLQATQSCSRLGDILYSALHTLQTPWTLSTGQGMNRLWKQFRPLTAASQSRLTSMLKLEGVADRFDFAVTQLHNISGVIYALRHSLKDTLSRLMEKNNLYEINFEV